MSEDESTPRCARRRILALAGGGVATALPGCSGTTGREQRQSTPVSGSGSDGTPSHVRHLGGPDREYDHELGDPGPTVTVTTETAHDAHYFGPGIAHVEVGGTVRWTHGSGAHSAVAYHPDNADRLPSITRRRIPDEAEPFATPELRTDGDTAEHSFEVPGIYDYCCAVPGHEAMGMVGRVVVGQPSLSDQPALQALPEALPDLPSIQLRRFNDRTRSVLGERTETTTTRA